MILFLNKGLASKLIIQVPIASSYISFLGVKYVYSSSSVFLKNMHKLLNT